MTAATGVTESMPVYSREQKKRAQTQGRAFRVFFNSYWPEILAVSACLLAFLRALDVHSQLLGWDIDGSPLDPKLALQRSLSAWAWHVGLGTDNSPAHAQVLLYAVEAALQRMGATAGGIQWIVYGLVFVSIPLGMGWYTRLVFERQPVARLIANLALAFNFYHAITWYTPLPVYEIGLLGGPLLAAAALSFARRRTPKTLALITLAALVTSPAGANAAVALVMLCSAVILGIVALERWPHDRRPLALPALLYGALNAFWIVPTSVFIFTQRSIVLAGEYVKNWGLGTLAATSGAATPSNVIRLIGTWDWTHNDAAGHRYIAYAPWYEHNPALVALSFILPALAIAALWSGNKRQALTIAGALVIALFLMKGTAAPFGAAYLWTFEHFAPFEAFRVPFSKFGIMAAPLLALLAGLGADAIIRRIPNRLRIVATAALFLAVATSIWPYWTGQMFRHNAYMPSYYVRLPAAYNELAQYLNTQQNESSRVLVLPFSPALSFSAFTWGYNGPDLLPYLVARPTITEADSWADPFTHLAFRDVMRSPGDLLNAVQRNAIEYILVHRDVDTKFYGAVKPSVIEALVRKAGGRLIHRLSGRALALYAVRQPKSRVSVVRLDKDAIGVTKLSAEQMASMFPLDVFDWSDRLGGETEPLTRRVKVESARPVRLPVVFQAWGSYDAGMLAASPGDIMRVSPAQPGLLIVSAAYNPGWVARGLRGAPRKAIADGTYNAWWVEAAGPIEVEYRPRRAWIFSALTSIGALLLSLAVCCWWSLRRQQADMSWTAP
jgi:hypothetical protein